MWIKLKKTTNVQPQEFVHIIKSFKFFVFTVLKYIFYEEFKFSKVKHTTNWYIINDETDENNLLKYKQLISSQ